MRIWSIHPKYLDNIGLVACWRETLLAKNVLLGLTSGYKNHPQLLRFKKSNSPIEYIDYYLNELYIEASARGYKFNKNKISNFNITLEKITVTQKQIEYEFCHLLSKLKMRSSERYKKIKNTSKIKANCLFKIVPGEIEYWEKI